MPCVLPEHWSSMQESWTEAVTEADTMHGRQGPAQSPAKTPTTLSRTSRPCQHATPCVSCSITTRLLWSRCSRACCCCRQLQWSSACPQARTQCLPVSQKQGTKRPQQLWAADRPATSALLEPGVGVRGAPRALLRRQERAACAVHTHRVPLHTALPCARTRYQPHPTSLLSSCACGCCTAKQRHPSTPPTIQSTATATDTHPRRRHTQTKTSAHSH